jgi:hypothetical protein
LISSFDRIEKVVYLLLVTMLNFGGGQWAGLLASVGPCLVAKIFGKM